MVLVYGLLRALATALRAVAAARHARAKRRYEQLADSFHELETSCKAHEVSVGRPADYASQLRLLQLFERTERARQRWVARVAALQKRVRYERAVRRFSGRKLPYTFGVIDMALLMKLAEVFGLNVNTISEAIRMSLL
jgi:hypothetical protein